MNRYVENIRQALESFEMLGQDEMTADQRDQVMRLLDDPGFGILMSLLIAGRQKLLLQLSDTPTYSEETRYSLAVTQGVIKGIDEIRQVMLSIAQESAPNDEGSE